MIPGAKAAKGNFLAQVRSAKATRAVTTQVAGASLLTAALVSAPPRIVLAIDATASREPCWAAAKQTTDILFSAVPGELQVALAVHGGSEVHTFTDFLSDASALRDRAAGVQCRAGQTMLVPLLDQVRLKTGVKTVIYVGDTFEEREEDLMNVATALRLRGTRVIVLHDTSEGQDPEARRVFAKLADTTQGAVLPFDPSSIERLRELLQAVAMLAVGGVKLLEAKAKQLPAARLLLANLSKS